MKLSTINNLLWRSFPLLKAMYFRPAKKKYKLLVVFCIGCKFYVSSYASIVVDSSLFVVEICFSIFLLLLVHMKNLQIQKKNLSSAWIYKKILCIILIQNKVRNPLSNTHYFRNVFYSESTVWKLEQNIKHIEGKNMHMPFFAFTTLALDTKKGII